MLWSQIIYGRLFHQKSYDSTAPVRRQPAAWIVRFFCQLLDIVRCPVKFRYYLKFHGARSAFGRVNEGKTHRTGTGRFLFKIYIVGFQRCASGHRTVPGRASYDVWQAPGTLKNLFTNRPMPVRAPDDARTGTGRCFMSRTATGEKRRVFAEEHIAFT